MLRSTTLILALFTAVLAAPTCSCDEQPSLKQAWRDARKGDSPYAVATVISEDRPSDHNQNVTYSLRTERCTKIVNATTNSSVARCGVNLMKNKVYVLRLSKDEAITTAISTCDVLREYDQLSESDRKFVKKKVRARCESVINSSCKRLKCSKAFICGDGSKCAPRKCTETCSPVGKCTTVGCHFGWECDLSRGLCVRNTSTCTTKCSKDYVCTTVGCESGYTCLLGKCYKNKS